MRGRLKVPGFYATTALGIENSEEHFYLYSNILYVTSSMTFIHVQ